MTRVYANSPPPPGTFVPCRTVLDELDDNVAPKYRGGGRKFRETEDIAPLRDIVANDAHLHWRGKVTEKYEEVSRALNEVKALPGIPNSYGKHFNDRYNIFCEPSKCGPSGRVSEWNTRGYWAEISCLRISSWQLMTTKIMVGENARYLPSATSVWQRLDKK
jgi:hypothetical protein